MDKVQLQVHVDEAFAAPFSVACSHFLEETLADIKEFLALDRRLVFATHYDLVYDGVRLLETYDDMEPLQTIFGEAKGEVRVDMVPRPYTMKDLYAHLAHFRRNVGLVYHDTMPAFTKYQAMDLAPVVQADSVADATAKADAKPELPQQVVESVLHPLLQSLGSSLPEHAHGQSILDVWEVPLKSLAAAAWNPVPPAQKIKGDLLYLTVTTLEGETFLVTCHVSGFFVSQTLAATFNPAAKQRKGLALRAYVLALLLEQLLPRFDATLQALLKRLAASHPYGELYHPPRAARPTWVVAADNLAQAHRSDPSRGQAAVWAAGVDGVEAVKDWNDEYQGIRDFPRGTLTERLLREQLLTRCIDQFTQTATATAMEIVQRNVAPLNAHEPRERHIFLRNNIFYSFAVNATGAHDELGGDEAARYCFAKDAAAVRLLNRVDVQGIANLLTCIVDYMGERVVCQAPVPGIFNDLGQKVAVGHSLDDGEIFVNDEFAEPLATVAEAFHLKKHTFEGAASSHGKELLVSKDTKGIFGTDGRKYLIDLYRTTPLDIDFLDAHYNENSPALYPHKEALVRHEAVEEWYKRKAAAIFKVETERLDKEGADEKNIALPLDQVAFNPDAFAGSGSDEDKATVREISQLIKKHLIPEFVDAVVSAVVPYDGVQLSDYMHRSGINMRYLGSVAALALERIAEFEQKEAKVVETNKQLLQEAAEKTEAEKKENESEEKADKDAAGEKKTESKATLVPAKAIMKALYELCIHEMIARASKHVLRKAGAAVSPALKATLVTHFFNCLFGVTRECSVDLSLKMLVPELELSFAQWTPKSVRDLVAKEVYIRFRYNLAADWSVKPLQMLREVSLKFGVQWLAKDFDFAQGLNAEDIVAFVPVTKDSRYRCSFVDEVFETARQKLIDEKDVGLDLLRELASFYVQIYGPVSPETTAFYLTLAQIYSENEMHYEAAITGRKALVLQERLTGFDSYEAINAYVKASYFEMLNKDLVSAFKLNVRAVHDWSVVYGANHPNVVNTFLNIATVLHEQKLDKDARGFFEKALEASVAVNGNLSDVTALLRHRRAVLLVLEKKYDVAEEQFAAAAEVFGQLLGPEDTLYVECTTFLTNLRAYIAYQKTNPPAATPKPGAKPGVKPTRMVPAVAAAKSGKAAKGSKKTKKGKKKEADSDMGLKSVEEILQYIEGKV